MNLITRQTCRICGNPHLEPVLDLGEQYLQGVFVRPSQPSPPLRKVPTQIVWCNPTKFENGCGLVQMKHTVPPEILYNSYFYRSGISRTMRDHLEEIANTIQSLINVKGKFVVDIGANDMTMLNYFPKNCKRIGIDPSDVTSKVKTTKIRVINEAFPSAELTGFLRGDLVHVFLSIAMMYDLENPVRFINEIRDMLAIDGVWVFEMAYLPSILKNLTYDTIVSEHLELYSLSVIENMLKRSGLKIFKAELNESNGGSLRGYVTHHNNYKYGDKKDAQFINYLRQMEFDLELDTIKPYEEFTHKVNTHKQELVRLLTSLKSKGKRIHLLGASTKSMALFQFCGIDTRIIDCAAERDVEKHGCKTLGTNIPIVSEETSRSMKPDYYLVGPYHFKDELLERERDALASGVRFIFPLPKIDII